MALSTRNRLAAEVIEVVKGEVAAGATMSIGDS
jgi:molybdopterin-binding protein